MSTNTNMTLQNTIKQIEHNKIVAIIRGIALEQMNDLFQALYDGGVKIAEITLNTDRALQSIELMRKQYGDRMLVGAGSVLDEAMAREAIAAGAQFLVSPNVDEGMITHALNESIVPLPGAFTPTEIVQAARYGAPLIKVFPSTSMGPQYMKDLQGPLGHIPMLAVGGVDLSNAAEYMKSGAAGIGIGSSLINKTWINDGHFEKITSYAIALNEQVR